jgi:sec-independent protein translocase protein TatA
MFSGADAPWHWVILIVLVVALFGYKKLPDAARSLGRSMRIFKTEIKGMTEDDAARDASKTVAPPAATLVKNAPAADAAPAQPQTDTVVVTPSVPPVAAAPVTVPATPVEPTSVVTPTTPGTV